ncbi:MAG: 50S ribosomal protein L11 methyltransferase [Gammaproteobacteria bacterium]|nr:50S ribosomal protein L11 methyltransferase [Gammaproteobacteria bacterium]MDH4253087.1 50S ribosomal protein L11 methyltransferase [Gammaproteobacteria bacterium]MDH5308913.1 50S ribosomal protein L11 methyltransferase [Gammaproteobacteria bacterium]
MEWRQLVMNLEKLEPERVEEIFERHGALAITLSDAADEPVLEPAPGETPLWGRTRITGLFAAEADLEALARDLQRSLTLDTLPEYRIEALADRAWEREWLRDFQPMRFGRRLWVCPSGHTVADRNAVVLHLDPGLAFGTGTHPTTALCLAQLDAADLAGKRVLDFGCGSGILAIAALLLGADTATGVDVDPQALLATRDNAAANGVAARLAVLPASADAGSGYDLVVANILAGPLVELASTLVAGLARGGRLLLSGILTTQVDQVRAVYEAWIDFDPPAVSAEWALLSGIKR